MSREEKARQTFQNLRDVHAPQRKYVRKDLEKIQDRLMRIQSVLLEYDQKNVLLSGFGRSGASGSEDTSTSANRLRAAAQEQQQAAKNQSIEAQEENLKRLMNEMSETERGGKASKISANTIGQILGLQQSTLQQIASEFDQKSNELQLEIDQLEKLLSTDGAKGLGGFQHKQRLANIIGKQIEQKEAALSDKLKELDEIKAKESNLKTNISEVILLFVYNILESRLNFDIF